MFTRSRRKNQVAKVRSGVSRDTSGQLVANICGHRTEQNGEVTAFETTITTEMPINNGGTVDYCLRCIGNMATRCAWCGLPIFIGDPVTMKLSLNPDYQYPDYAYFCDDGTVVGCLRASCCDTIAERSGFWLPDTTTSKGAVHNRHSIFAQAMLGPVVIADITQL